MSSIDTKKCPVYMLTGEYDWSNTPAMGQATCDKITGGKHQAMKGVGHFPATENPKVFVGYRECRQSSCFFEASADVVCFLVLEAVTHIQSAHQ
jgi:hypothetical protein